VEKKNWKLKIPGWDVEIRLRKRKIGQAKRGAKNGRGLRKGVEAEVTYGRKKGEEAEGQKTERN